MPWFFFIEVEIWFVQLGDTEMLRVEQNVDIKHPTQLSIL